MNKDKIREIQKLCSEILAEPDQPEEEMEFPPEGMAIQVYHSSFESWLSVISQGRGKYSHGPESRAIYLLSDVQWRYWPAPPIWPEWAHVWLGLSTCEYMFSSLDRLLIGEELSHGRVLYAESPMTMPV